MGRAQPLTPSHHSPAAMAPERKVTLKELNRFTISDIYWVSVWYKAVNLAGRKRGG